jgi:hypothetical protein
MQLKCREIKQVIYPELLSAEFLFQKPHCALNIDEEADGFQFVTKESEGLDHTTIDAEIDLLDGVRLTETF